MEEKISMQEKKFLEKLKDRFGGDVTLNKLLNLENNIPIEDVYFWIKGYYKNAYECTGDSFYIEGTILDIFEDDFCMHMENRNVPLSDILSEEQITSLTNVIKLSA